MGSLYSGTSVSGYNSNPPPDDGSTVATNQITWAGIKSKLGDPLNTFASSISSALQTSFTKTLSGATVVKTGVSYAMTAADQGRLIVATASGITITTPDATSVLNPFLFGFSNQSTSTITIAGFSAQTVDGNNTTTIFPGCGAVVWTDGSNWFTSGLVQGNIRTANPAFGFDAPINLQLNASVGSNLLTIAVKGNNGSDPSSSNPVLIPFRDSTIANGDPVWVAVTAALSINTNAVGASLGTQNSSVPFRLWVLAFNNAGTVVLALWQSVTGTISAIAPLNEGTLQSTTGISAAATSAGVFYTPNGTTLSSKAFRIIGYVDYASGLATAGTYASAPTTVQLFGPGIKKPGDIMQMTYQLNGSATTVASTTKTLTGSVVTLSPTSTPNLIRVRVSGLLETPVVTNTTQQALAQIARSSAATNPSNLIGTIALQLANATGSVQAASTVSLEAFDNPGTTSSTQYSVYVWSNTATTSQWSGSVNGNSTQASMIAEEIQV